MEPLIRAHVLICWLALLLTRVAEGATGHTWNSISTELSRIAAVTLVGPAGTVVQTTELTDKQRQYSAPARCYHQPGSPA